MRQYDNSPVINQLLANMAGYLDMSKITEDFYDVLWNVDTAQGIGLDIWGRKVGVNRFVTIPSVDYFGFQDGATPEDWSPFGENAFYPGAASTYTFELSDSAFRLLILTKAFANVTRCNAPTLNALLQILFAGRGRCYVNDQGNMQMRYTFEFALEPWEFTVLTNGTVLPRSAGVQATLIQVALPMFGFQEAGYSALPFNEGVLMSTGALHNVA